MAYIDTDLDLVHQNGKDIVDEIVDAQRLINTFFEKLTESHRTGEMEGNNARLYCNTVRPDKRKYIEFTDAMKEIGEEMMRFSSDADDEVRRVERQLENSRY